MVLKTRTAEQAWVFFWISFLFLPFHLLLNSF